MPFVKPSCSLSGPKGISLPSFIPGDKTIQGYHSEDGEKRLLLSCWELWWPETGVAAVTEWTGLLSLGDHAGVMSRQVCTDCFSWLFSRQARCWNLLAIIHSTNAAPHYFPSWWIHNVHWAQIARAWACSMEHTVAAFSLNSTTSVREPARIEMQRPRYLKQKKDFLFFFLNVCKNPISNHLTGFEFLKSDSK